MEYCRNLEFTQAPDYKYLRKIFSELFYKMGYSSKTVFDWVDLESPGKKKNIILPKNLNSMNNIPAADDSNKVSNIL